MVEVTYTLTFHPLLWSILNVCLPQKTMIIEKTGIWLFLKNLTIIFYLSWSQIPFLMGLFWREISHAFQIRSQKWGFSFKKRVLPTFDLENWPEGQKWWYSQMFSSVLVHLCPNCTMLLLRIDLLNVRHKLRIDLLFAACKKFLYYICGMG